MLQDSATDHEPGYLAGANLEPETVLPAQFHTPARTDSSLVPEKRLLLAVLEEALATLRRYAGATNAQGRRLFSEAQQWFASNDVGWPCSFVSICDALDIDASRVRAGLARWIRDARPSRGRAGTTIVQLLVPSSVEAVDVERRSA